MMIDPKLAPAYVKTWLEQIRPAIDDEIGRQLDAQRDASAPASPRLVEAMRYAALGPGKRLRPALVLAACDAAGGDRRAALPAAAAVELLHAYTLVHDDLPAMDDDDERRGRPTVHIAFGEALAILAGDGLLTAAFGALADLGPRASDAIRVLARRAGAGELLAGQALDLSLALALAARTADQPPTLDEDRDGRGVARIDFDALEDIHARKTGALFAASAELGGVAAGADDATRAMLARYGMAVGVAFQHADDQDDAEFREHAARARQRMIALTDEAAAIARQLGEPGHTLAMIAAWIGRVAR